MKLVVTGTTGLIGSALVREAEKKSIEVVKLVRRAPKEKMNRNGIPIEELLI